MKINKIVYFLIFIFLSACSERKTNAPSNEVLIVSSYEDSLYSAIVLEEFLKSKNRHLPIEEDYYSIKWINANDFEEYTHYPSIMMLKINNPKDNTGDKLYDRIFYNKKYGSDVNFIKNFYIDNQSVIGVEAKDVVELNKILNEYSSNILNEIDNNLSHLILEKYYEKPKNEIIINEIKNKYGITVFIDHEYQKFDTNNDDILWIGRGFPHWNDPYRWIIIREIEPCEQPKLCLSYIQDTFNQTVLDSSFISISPYSSIQSYRYKHNENYVVGGSYQYFNIVYNPDDLFEDSDDSGKWDLAEEFTDALNGEYDEGEYFIDANNNGKWDLTEEFTDALNGEYDEGEYFLDNNNNGKWDDTETLTKDYNFNNRWDSASLDSIPNVGGPYISYIYNKENSSILLIGLINNPGQDKMIYLKQMESIFRDIK